MIPKDKLIEENLGLAVWQANLFHRKVSPRILYEDLYSEGVFGLVQAAEKYEERDDCSFATFAYHRVRGQILDFLRKEFFVRQDVERPVFISIDALVPFGDASFAEEFGIKPIPPLFLEPWLKNLVETRLSKAQKTVIYGYFWKNQYLREISKELGIFESRTSQIKTSALKTLHFAITTRRRIRRHV